MMLKHDLLWTALAATAAITLVPNPGYSQAERIGDLTVMERDVPRRLVGYGLIVGLDGTGDQSFGSVGGATHTVQSVVNLLKRFGISVPSTYLRLRNVAAVLVTAEASPYLRSGGRFDVQVASVGDATSIAGGVLWTTALMEDVGRPVVATAQGPIIMSENGERRFYRGGGTAGRIPDGGVLEVDPVSLPVSDSVRLFLKQPNVGMAIRIADAVNAGFGDGTAEVEDPGAVKLNLPAQAADNQFGFLAAVDTLRVELIRDARLVVDARSGTLVAGRELAVGPAVVSHRGITLTVSSSGADPVQGGVVPGLVTAEAGVTVQEIAAGLHAAGAQPEEIGVIFEALRDVGALSATVVIR